MASGTSKANTGVIHTGLEADPGSLMAKLCVEGNRLMWELSEELDFPVKKNGKFIVCTHEEDLPKLHEQLDHAEKNGVPGCRIVPRDEVLRLEPNLTGENANVNGVAFKFETEAYDIIKANGFYTIKTNRGDIQTKAIANAAGVYADKFHNMVSEKKIHITPRKGEYIFFDKSLGTIFNATVVPLPGKMGKGIAASQTIHGNFFVGPTATDVDDKESFQTTQEVLDSLKEIAASPDFLHKNPLPLNKIITSFVGLRAHEDHHEFIVEEVADAENFFDAAGIESPGLTSSPAIGMMLSGIIAEKMQLKKKTNFIARRKGVLKFDSLSDEEKMALIKEKPEYGNIVCRCEMVTEGEIMDAINRPIGAKSMDSVKRRTRAGMGRCQAGFCTPRTMEILSRELGIKMTDITKKGGASQLLTGCDKEIGQE